MYFPEAFALLALFALAAFWIESLRARDLGVAAARVACRDQGLQFLDDTVVSSKLRFTRDSQGRVCLERRFEFEYSDTGDNRRRGHIVIQGRLIAEIYTGPTLLRDIREPDYVEGCGNRCGPAGGACALVPTVQDSMTGRGESGPLSVTPSPQPSPGGRGGCQPPTIERHTQERDS